MSVTYRHIILGDFDSRWAIECDRDDGRYYVQERQPDTHSNLTLVTEHGCFETMGQALACLAKVRRACQ